MSKIKQTYEDWQRTLITAGSVPLPKQAFEARYNAECNADNWISVEDRLPDVLTDVLCINSRGECFVGYRTHTGRWSHDNVLYYHVTHWQPLPLAPKGGEQ